MSRVTPPDICLWVCNLLRRELNDIDDLEVDIRIPDTYRADHPLIVIRDDGGTQSERILFDRSLGISCYGWTPTWPAPLYDLAARTYSILTDDALAFQTGTPIAAVDESGCNGPYAASCTLGCALYYMTVQYVTVGTWNERTTHDT